MHTVCRFRLRTLLLVVLIAGVVTFGARTWRMRAHSQARTVELIVSLGGVVVYDFERDTNRGPSSLRRWLARNVNPHYFGEVIEIWIAEDNFGPVDVTNKDLEEIADLASLEALAIAHGCFVSDVGIKHLSRLSSLRKLDLSGCSVSDQSIQYMVRLNNLEELSLFATDVGDEGAATLCSLQKLRTLNLDETSVSRACVDNLKSKMPRTQIIWTDPASSPFAK